MLMDLDLAAAPLSQIPLPLEKASAHLARTRRIGAASRKEMAEGS